MQSEQPAAAYRNVALTPASSGLARFEIAITAAEPGSASRSVLVTGPNPASDEQMMRKYNLPDTGHHSYLDLFEALAGDYGMRLPRSRRPLEAPNSTTPLMPLLTEALSPDILYGYGDPAVTRVLEDSSGAGTASYYLLATSNDAPQVFPILYSQDLTDWQPLGFVFPQGHAPRWAAEIGQGGEYWAPEMHRVGSEFLVCFAARETDNSFSIGLAKSSHPGGPFIAVEAPILRGNVIDPHILLGHEGSAYLFWKEDTNDVWPSRLCRFLHEHGLLIEELFPHEEDRRTAAFTSALWPWVKSLGPMERFFVLQTLVEAVVSDFQGFSARLSGILKRQTVQARQEAIAEILRLTRTPVYAQELNLDTLTLLGERRQVLQNDQEWEGHLVEGVWVSEHGGRYYMLYAGNDFSTAEYGIGVAVADSPLGPYRKTEEPLLRSTADWSGPGHPSVAVGPDAQPWLFLHAFFPGRSGYKEFRAVLGLTIAFGTEGILLRPHPAA
ncbi:family 43 glycosylhydrolase [Belnapia sp. T18]|uniref:Family 43 glycosylhydrolase n=1 Tax=Belnapia arida TaxID=2804533 RepID=A0ABS1U6R9_9PROT|nr:family 43 glycosylhydrolase [Belnapia arida]MBL6079629.1 family 43 glycosylhydrolase [Belnapia arida]